jgi:hypothetical protein
MTPTAREYLRLLVADYGPDSVLEACQEASVAIQSTRQADRIRQAAEVLSSILSEPTATGVYGLQDIGLSDPGAGTPYIVVLVRRGSRIEAVLRQMLSRLPRQEMPVEWH